jgi:hypothetical protein
MNEKVGLELSLLSPSNSFSLSPKIQHSEVFFTTAGIKFQPD